MTRPAGSDTLVHDMRSLRKPLAVSLLTVAVLAAGGILVLKGCADGVPPEGWTATPPPPEPVDLMAGAWEGDWASDSKPLRGKLTAVIVKLPDDTYRASFDAENPLGSNNKSVCIFRIDSKADAWTFSGKENLGLLKGGTYTYLGSVDGKTFTCTYDSTFDKGVFRMTRRQTTTSPAAGSGNVEH